MACAGNGMVLGRNAGRLVRGLVPGKNNLDAPTHTFLEFCGKLAALRM